MFYEAIFKYEKKINVFGKVLEEVKMIEQTKNKVRKFF